MSHTPCAYPSTQREVELVVGIDEDGDSMLFARHPNGVEEWLCGDREKLRSCHSTTAAELNMLCYGRAETRVDLVIVCEDGERVPVYKPAGEKLWRETCFDEYVSYDWFVDLFLFYGVRYHLR